MPCRQLVCSHYTLLAMQRLASIVRQYKFQAHIRHTSKRELLQQLSVETFVLDTEQPLEKAPELTAFKASLDDDGALEVEVAKGQGLNALFIELENLGIRVLSMRTKANRLEELFVRMVEENAREAEKASEVTA